MLTAEDINRLDDLDASDLSEYLLNRFDHGLVVLMSCDEDEGNDVRCQWNGNSHTVAGLAVHAQMVVIDRFKESSKKDG